jgi:DNA repair exonuclease SbcCD ATPase subunit
MIRHGERTVGVRLQVDGHTTRRVRGPRGSHYDIDGRQFKAVGTSVPNPVAELLALTPDNFQFQGEPLYLLSESPPEIARRLNRVVNLGRIDELLTTAAQEVRKAQAAVDVSRERLDAAERRAEELAWVEDAHRRLRAVEDLQGELEEVRDQAEGLGRLVAELEQVESSLAGDREMIDAAEAVLEGFRQGQEARAEADGLAGLVSGLEDVEQLLRQTRTNIKDVERQLRTEFKQCPICGRPLADRVE